MASTARELAVGRPTRARSLARLRRLTGDALPHEIAFGALYAAVIVALLGAPGGPAWGEAAIWLSFGAASLVVARATALGSLAAWRIRLGAYLVLMNAAYFRMAPVVHALGRPLRDAALQRIDTALFGAPLPALLGGWAHPVASELLSACYFLLFPYLALSCWRQWRGAGERLGESRRFHAGIFIVYAVGFLGYLLVPARGPWLDIPSAFPAPVPGGWMTALNLAVVRHGSTQVDVFPSLHVAASAFMLAFDARTAPRRFARWAIPVVGIWVSTIYLRFHYGVDVLAGLALAALGVGVAFRWRPTPITLEHRT